MPTATLFCRRSWCRRFSPPLARGPFQAERATGANAEPVGNRCRDGRDFLRGADCGGVRGPGSQSSPQ
eukprot:11223247-Lingulodinium_polyedra.AAC.1